MILRFLILVAAFAIMPIIPGVRVKSVMTAIGAAMIFSLLNFFIGWFFKFMLVVGTLGLAFLALTYLTNVILLWLTDKLLENLDIKGGLAIFLGAGLVTVANAVGASLRF